MQVRDTVLALEDAGALQLDLLGSEALEQQAALAEEDGDDVELELVQHAAARASRVTPAPWTSTFLSPAASFALAIAVVTSST
jgi:hypothetical protein